MLKSDRSALGWCSAAISLTWANNPIMIAKMRITPVTNIAHLQVDPVRPVEHFDWLLVGMSSGEEVSQ